MEIKLGAGEIDHAAKTLMKVDAAMKESSGKSAAFLAVICGMAFHAYRREDGVIVIPRQLWVYERHLIGYE